MAIIASWRDCPAVGGSDYFLFADDTPRIVASPATCCTVYNRAQMALSAGTKLGAVWDL